MFTDIEGSTDLLRSLGGEAFGQELRRHRERIGEAAVAYNGRQLGTEGDAVFIAFPRASDAVAAAQHLRAAFAEEPVRLRVGIHTGEPLVVDNEYVGLEVRTAARIARPRMAVRCWYHRRRASSRGMACGILACIG